MKIAVIGANGRSGTAFIKVALARGHEIRAGVHHSPLHVSESENLVTMTIDATNSTHVGELIEGCDAVVSLIGHVRHSPVTVQTDAIQRIIEQMKIRGIVRLLSLTGTGVRMPGDTISLIDRCMNAAISVVDPKRIHDGISHVKAIQASDLDWTIIRVLKLTNSDQQAASLSAGGPALTFVSRYTVAQKMVDILEQHSFTQQAPVIAKNT